MSGNWFIWTRRDRRASTIFITKQERDRHNAMLGR